MLESLFNKVAGLPQVAVADSWKGATTYLAISFSVYA